MKHRFYHVFRSVVALMLALMVPVQAMASTLVLPSAVQIVEETATKKTIARAAEIAVRIHGARTATCAWTAP